MVQDDIKPGTSLPAFPRRRRRWPLLLIGLGVGMLLLASASFAGATMLEENNAFCASCHTAPEETYYNRVTKVLGDPGAAALDLASMHFHQTQAKNQSFACISCHRGDASLSQRIQTLALGASDILIFVSGKADLTLEKTKITQPILPNSACISCHTDTLLTVRGTATHYHNMLPQTAALLAVGQQWITSGNQGRFRRMQTVSNVSIFCTDCHLAHTTTSSDPQLKFVNRTPAQQACDTCHQAVGERPQTIDRLLQEGRRNG
jgi:nitrate/TMAO reductase-like tetraheme cytochrome c subunit